MKYTEQDVERVAEAIWREDYFWNTGVSPDHEDEYHTPITWEQESKTTHRWGRSVARAALEAIEREPLVHGDLLDRLTRVAEAGFHWWEAWADEGDYDGEYKHMDREQRIDHILCHDLLLALDALAPDYFDGLTGKPKYAVAAAKGDE